MSQYKRVHEREITEMDNFQWGRNYYKVPQVGISSRELHSVKYKPPALYALISSLIP